jgi:E3 ubiquitin-protein ligase DOA10
MWFIKDPQDQNFHPIRDILERPTLTQLRKLLVSALMYSIVVAVGVGSVAGLLFAAFNSILPLRWKTRLVSLYPILLHHLILYFSANHYPMYPSISFSFISFFPTPCTISDQRKSFFTWLSMPGNILLKAYG